MEQKELRNMQRDYLAAAEGKTAWTHDPFLRCNGLAREISKLAGHLADQMTPIESAPPADNDHVAAGCEQFPTPSLPSVAEVIAKQYVMILAHPGGDCSWVGKNTGFRVDLHPLTVQDVLKEIITAALSLHEQREKEALRIKKSANQQKLHSHADEIGHPNCVLPDIGREIAEKAVIKSPKRLWVESDGDSILLGEGYDRNRVVNRLASLVNQGVARGAMEQYEKMMTIARRELASSIRHVNADFIDALAATKPEGAR